MARRRGESSIEAACVRLLKRLGLLSRKMNGLGNMGWPDRLVLNRVGAGRRPPLWVELKKPGEVPTRLQAQVHAELRSRGESVAVVDSVAGFEHVVRDHFGLGDGRG